MRAHYTTWDDDFDDRGYKYRSAGSSVTVTDDVGTKMTWSVPNEFIAKTVTELLNEYFREERHTPHSLRELADQLNTAAFYYGMEWAVGEKEET